MVITKSKMRVRRYTCSVVTDSIHSSHSSSQNLRIWALWCGDSGK